MRRAMTKIILGIETSCDETAVAIITSDGKILSNKIYSQIEHHKAFGGVVPEVAARAHLDILDTMIKDALDEAGLSLSQLDGIAATAGPGLIGGVLVGVTMAKSIAWAEKIPFYAVNHLEGHALMVRLIDEVPFPYLLLLVSGGHSQFLIVEGVGKYKLLGTTIDDAVGESFDKSAKVMGLEFPGGPNLEIAAKKGNPKAFKLPRPLRKDGTCNFSFSGLKTAVRRSWEQLPDAEKTQQTRADLCASFQAAVGDVLSEKCKNALEVYTGSFEGDMGSFVVSGGVAANQYIRDILKEQSEAYGVNFKAPPVSLCTDNAAMIAWAALERINGNRDDLGDALDFRPRPRWPLEELSA